MDEGKIVRNAKNFLEGKDCSTCTHSHFHNTPDQFCFLRVNKDWTHEQTLKEGTCNRWNE